MLGILCWKIIRFNKGESFSSLSGLDVSEEVTPSVSPSLELEKEDGVVSGKNESEISVTPVERVRVSDILLTENEELSRLFGEKEDDLLYGDDLPGKVQVIDDTIGIEKKGDMVLSAEFYAKNEEDEWLRFVYEPDSEKIRVENCEEERKAFVAEQTRTRLCLTWVGLENTEAYDSELFLNAQDRLLSYLQEVLFDGAYYDTYLSLDHKAAKELLSEEADYAQFVWYVDNLRSHIQKRVSDQLVVNYLGCDKRDGYCYVGVQFGNFNSETGDYREIIEVWCVLFLSEEQEVRGFWMFGPGVLERLG